MKILKNSITYFASRQYLGIMIPDIAIGDCEYEEVPDDWVHFNKRDCILELTRKGWNANKNKLQKAFINSVETRGYTWKQFEDVALKCLEKQEKHKNRY